MDRNSLRIQQSPAISSPSLGLGSLRMQDEVGGQSSSTGAGRRRFDTPWSDDDGPVATGIEFDDVVSPFASPPRTPLSERRVNFTPQSERVSARSNRTPRRSHLRDRAHPVRRLVLEERDTAAELRSEADMFAAKALSHRLEETDPYNFLYSSGFPLSDESDEEPDGQDDHDYLVDEVDDTAGSRRRKRERSYFTNSPADVVRILQYYSPKNNSRNKLEILRKEEITARSTLTRLSTHQNNPVVLFHNQMYRPKEQTSSGYVVAKCTFVDENKKTCPGSLHCSWVSGECVLHRECTHPSRRDQIAVLLIDRRLAILEKGGASIERCTEIAVTLADDYNISAQMLGNNESIARRINDKSYGRTATIAFPPDYDWFSEKNVVCLSYDAANFKANNCVTAIWKIRGADEWLCGATKVLHLDGKYSEVPSGFSQLYVISTQNPETGKAIPLIFALTNSSTKETYKEILRTAKQIGLNPDEVFSDFELAIIGAVGEIWPAAQINLCWRHWKCSLKKKLIEMVGIRLHRQAPFQLLLKAVYALSFAPLDKCQRWFSILKARTATLHPRMDGYFDYLSRTYFSDTATFHRKLWNCNRRASLGLEFTNNPSEGVFAKYKRLFVHNSYRQLNRVIRKSAQWVETVYKDEISGRNRPNRNPRYRLYKDRAFLDTVNTHYLTFDSFERSVNHWMRAPKIGH